MKAVIFDFDGVFQDNFDELFKVHNEVLERITVEDFKVNVFGNNPRKYFDRFSEEKKHRFDETWSEYYSNFTLEPEIRDMLFDLKEHFMLFVVTSNTERNLLNYCKNNQIEGVFSKIYGVETSKSKVKKLQILLEEYVLGNNEVVFVTDTLGDVLEGKKAGIKVIAVDFGFHERILLEKGEPYKIVSSLQEVRDSIFSLIG